MEKFPKNMAAPLLLLPLIFLSNLADPVQCKLHTGGLFGSLQKELIMTMPSFFFCQL